MKVYIFETLFSSPFFGLVDRSEFEKKKVENPHISLIRIYFVRYISQDECSETGRKIVLLQLEVNGYVHT